MIANRSMPPGAIIPELAYSDVRGAAEWLCRAFVVGLIPVPWRFAATASVATALVLGCTGGDDDSATPAEPPATLDHPAPTGAAAGLVLPTPKEPLPTPQPTAPAAPLVIGGHVTRPDGSPVRGAKVKFCRRDDRGELADVLAGTETDWDGAFEVATGDLRSQPNAVRCSWQRFRNGGLYDVVVPMPVGPPVEGWFDLQAIPDWTAMSIVLDTGWTVSGLVQSHDPRFEANRTSVTTDVVWQIDSVGETGVFYIQDIPWEADRCRVDVLDWLGVVASGEATRPDREHGARETWIEILVPMR